MYADLHLHTTASDGFLTPAEVVRRARMKNYSAIAITDHDTLDGLKEASRTGEELNIEVIPGVELSTLSGDKDIHILGYYIDEENPFLKEKLASLIQLRQKRADKMIERLNGLGLLISIEQVQAIAGGAFIGRPHLARALMEKGYITNIKEAFTEEYLGKSAPAYVRHYRMTPEEGIELVLNAGGVPVLAHPGYLNKGLSLTKDEIKSFISSGLQGIEAIYSRHSKVQTEYYKSFAAEYGLLVTGGSDCHGDNNDIRLGTVKLPYEYVENMKKRRR